MRRRSSCDEGTLLSSVSSCPFYHVKLGLLVKFSCIPLFNNALYNTLVYHCLIESYYFVTPVSLPPLLIVY